MGNEKITFEDLVKGLIMLVGRSWMTKELAQEIIQRFLLERAYGDNQKMPSNNT